MSGKPIRIAFLGDTKDLDAATSSVGRSVNRAADDVVAGGKRIDSSFASTAEGADLVASRGAQAAGGLSGLGSVALLAGGNVGKLGAGMVVAGTATQALADAGDLLNVVTESTIVKTALSKAQMIGSAIATRSVSAATKGYAVAQRVLNIAMSANPIGALVTGLVLLGTVLVVAYKKSQTFRNIVNGAFGAVKSVVGGVLPTLEKVLGFIVAFPLKIAELEGKMLLAGGKLIGGLLKGLKPVGGAIGDIGKSIVNSIIGYLNDILPHSISISKGPIHVSVPLFPTIPQLAKGGVVTGPTLALIGDNPGGREAVIPLDKYRLGGNTYQIRLEAPVGSDAYTIGETLVSFIREYEEAGGD